MTGRERDFADARGEINESMTMSAVNAILRLCRAAFSRPRSSSPPATLKGSLYTVAAIVGVITHVLLLQLMPDAIAPVKPMAYGMVLAFAAFASAVGFITRRSSATATADSSAGTANTRNN